MSSCNNKARIYIKAKMKSKDVYFGLENQGHSSTIVRYCEVINRKMFQICIQ